MFLWDSADVPQAPRARRNESSCNMALQDWGQKLLLLPVGNVVPRLIAK